MNYAECGVDRDRAFLAKKLIQKHAKATLRPEVLSEIGLFGGLFELKSPQVLISSVDGVGTKLKIAELMSRYDTVGIDLVNHCVNDILTLGASPLFFLDYIGCGRISPEHIEKIIQGISHACRDVGCALIGGELAEMPGIYHGEDFDLVGFIVGGVERGKIIWGKNIKGGDPVLGLPSSGLHTNGYSLVRQVLKIDVNPQVLEVYHPELQKTLGEELLIPHACYYHSIKDILPLVKGVAHITGGGIEENVSRILPPGLCVHIEYGSWVPSPIFNLIKREGKVSEEEMRRVFNLGIGMVLISSPDDVPALLSQVKELKVIGEVKRS
jgi:phosphoribosylformylglycinamidine cyclo-ligase